VRILFDTNVVLDVLLARGTYAVPAADLLARIERHSLVGLLGSTTITTIHYIARRTLGDDGAREQIRRLLQLFEVAPVDRAVVDDALDLGLSDFEDAVLHECARHASADGIVTRNTSDFASARLPVYTPQELLGILDATTRKG
jgi:predicted nucleic acid-binding protein